MRFSRDEMIDKIVKREINRGGHFQTGRKHGRLYTLEGYCIVVPGTPSDKRAGLNFRSFLRRKTQKA